jgi:hypothetical protein
MVLLFGFWKYLKLLNTLWTQHICEKKDGQTSSFFQNYDIDYFLTSLEY